MLRFHYIIARHFAIAMPLRLITPPPLPLLLLSHFHLTLLMPAAAFIR